MSRIISDQANAKYFVLRLSKFSNIYKLLKKGQIDTKSLGELTGNQGLMDLEPSHTKLKRVVDYESENGIKFTFDVIREVP